uniref:Uncharacterized protein n=1 Tax=Cannabis sativa TaxID=3483 RepID=A0A803R655_CANSA
MKKKKKREFYLGFNLAFLFRDWQKLRGRRREIWKRNLEYCDKLQMGFYFYLSFLLNFVIFAQSIMS